MKPLEILIEPSFESTMKEMGISPDEDYNSDAILFQQGYNMYHIEVEPGDKFKIKKNTKGQIDCSETPYKFIRKKEEWETEENLWEEEYEDEENISLAPGKYKFLEDGITIEEIN
ncbi:hypothetical protein [Flavobacterium frigoris]|uniref:Uncharacterized protein n=1 Tax=Flavobacterium frigoris TaxID=229204 RepID=A0A1H9I0D1_FLAFI|nr:hypothetical protein [Flavobacterium frigoris]SEQ68100.1 hypothetical protein SAMN05444355_103320 [Flavobacterium frigoris]